MARWHARLQSISSICGGRCWHPEQSTRTRPVGKAQHGLCHAIMGVVPTSAERKRATMACSRGIAMSPAEAWPVLVLVLVLYRWLSLLHLIF